MLRNEVNLHERFGKSFYSTSDRVPHNGEVTLVDSTINGGCYFLQQSNSFDEVPNVMLPFVYLITTTPIQTISCKCSVVCRCVVIFVLLFKKNKKKKKKREYNQEDVNTILTKRVQNNSHSTITSHSWWNNQQNHMRTPKLLAT